MRIIRTPHSDVHQTHTTRRITEVRPQIQHERTLLHPGLKDVLDRRALAGLVFGGSVAGAMRILYANSSLYHQMDAETRTYITQLLNYTCAAGAINGALMGTFGSAAAHADARPEIRNYASVSGPGRNWRDSVIGVAFSTAVFGASASVFCLLAAWACYPSKTDEDFFVLNPGIAASVGLLIAGAADLALSRHRDAPSQARTTRGHAAIPLQRFLAEP